MISPYPIRSGGQDVPLKKDVFMWNGKQESIDPDELSHLKLKRLQKTCLKLEQNVPFYQKLFAQAKLSSQSIKSLDDLRRLPFTTKADLRNQYPLGMLAEKRKDLSRIHASSGTRGKPTLVCYTKADLDLWAELCARCLTQAGVKASDLVHNSFGYGLFTGGLGLHYGAEKIGAQVVPASGGNTSRQAELILDLGAGVLLSTPSYALNLARAIEEMGAKKEDLPLRVGIFGGEPWSEDMRARLEEELNITAFDIYGTSEIIGPGVASECRKGKSGLHIWEDHFLCEIIDPNTLEPLPFGEEGELVITTLTKEAMPLLRFRTGDITCLTNDPCPCQRTMARMQRVRGRLDDMLIVRGVNLYPSEVESLLLQFEELSAHYQIIVDREKALDVLEVQVEVKDSLVMAGLGKRIGQSFKETLGLSVQVTLMPPFSMAANEGKAQRVIDRRQI